MWKNEFLQPKINSRDRGQIEWVTGMFFVLVVFILLYAQLQLISWQTAGMYLEDALAASNLACSLVDLSHYEGTGKLQITDMQRVYQIYEEALQINLNLNAEWECENQELLSGAIRVEDFVVYNVAEDLVYAYRLNQSGEIAESWSTIKTNARTPNGKKVENTGIYSEISFDIKGFPGVEIPARKGQFTDIYEGRE